jgi:hypothetical protein
MCPPEVVLNEEIWRGRGSGKKFIKIERSEGKSRQVNEGQNIVTKGSTKTEFIGMWKQKKAKKCLEETRRRGAMSEVLKEVNKKNGI